MKTGNLGLKDKLYVAYWEARVFFKPKKLEAKIFCIGYNKTGTTALGNALRILGYDHSTFNRNLWLKHYKNKNYEEILDYTARFESFDELPWLKEDMIPILYDKFPGSKFIYLTRDEKSWKKSIKNWTYKVAKTNADVDKHYAAYLEHQKFVLDFFKDKSDSLLTLDISDAQGFEKLGKFLGRPAPQPGFPVINKT